MKRSTKVVVGVCVGAGCLLPLLFILFLVLLIPAVARLAPGRMHAGLGDKVALIHISGVITGGRGGGGFLGEGSAGAERIVNQLERARQDDSVKAIVLRINSTGGSAAGSQEIYLEVMRVRKDGKPVVTSMGDVAASGGYYVASASDAIYAEGSTLTGSIGVITQTSNMSALFKKIGIEFEVVKSGKHKDMGSGLRNLTPEERQMMQAMISDVFDQFLTAVSEGRKIPKAKVRKLADGRVFTGRQARKLGLIDEEGGLRDATIAAARRGGIKGDPTVVEYDQGFFEGLFGDSASESLKVSPEETFAGQLLRMAPDLGE